MLFQLKALENLVTFVPVDFVSFHVAWGIGTKVEDSWYNNGRLLSFVRIYSRLRQYLWTENLARRSLSHYQLQYRTRVQ